MSDNIMKDIPSFMKTKEEIARIESCLDEVRSGGFLLRLDIDNLRGINIANGNKFGDYVITKAYACINSVLEEHQNLYWLSGGDFIVMSNSGDTLDEAQEVYYKIQNAVKKLIIDNEYSFFFSLCCGILVLKKGSHTSNSEIIKRAEFALAKAKAEGENLCSTFYKREYEAAIERHNLMVTVQKSVHENLKGFSLKFQPIVNGKGEIVAAETLLRFKDDEVGIGPTQVIPILEETGLIIPVGEWILEEALKFCKKITEYKEDFRISVNLSYVEAKDTSKLEFILKALEKYDVNPENLVIELTESGQLESDQWIKRFWKGLKKAGIKLALDDFGTGFSNFHYLESLSPDLLKVDNTISREAMNSPKHFKILEAISKVVNFLDLQLCIEGIENEDFFEAMKELHSELYQGYYFSKPCTEEDFIEKFLENLKQNKK